MCTVSMNSKSKQKPLVTGFIKIADVDKVDTKNPAFGFLVNAPIEVPYALFFPGDVVFHTTNGSPEKGMFGGAIFLKDSGEEFAVIRSVISTDRLGGKEFLMLPWDKVRQTGMIRGIGQWNVRSTILELIRTRELWEMKDAAPNEKLKSPTLLDDQNHEEQEDEDSSATELVMHGAFSNTFSNKRRSNRVQENGVKQAKLDEEAATIAAKNRTDELVKRAQLQQEAVQQQRMHFTETNTAMNLELISVKKNLAQQKRTANAWKKKATESPTLASPTTKSPATESPETASPKSPDLAPNAGSKSSKKKR